MRLHYGVHRVLEDAADAIIKESLQGVTSQAAKSDILTPWKMQDRLSREVYVPSGTADPAMRRGIYHRAYNRDAPHLNSRDGTARGHRVPSLRTTEAPTQVFHSSETEEQP